MRTLREENSPTIGLAFIRGVSGASVLGTLSRYETMLERSYYRALHELQRFQQARRGEYVPAPLAVDITVNGGSADATPPAAADGGAKEEVLAETRTES